MPPFRRVLITGIAGAAASYLAESILARHPDMALHGVARPHRPPERWVHLEKISDRLEIHAVDLTDEDSVRSVVTEVRPDAVFHLASDADVRASFEHPRATLHNNVSGTLNLLEALRLSGSDARILLSSTSKIYASRGPTPLREDAPLGPVSPYAVSKLTEDLLGRVYFESYGLKIIRVRMFGYINPRRPDIFTSAFARQIARVERGLQEELLHGNLDSVQTLMDIRDAVEASWLACSRGEPGEAYNIGSEAPVSVGELLAVLKRHCDVPVRTRLDPQLLRPSDVTAQIPSVDKFRKATGWKLNHSFEDSVGFLLDYWRQRVHRETAAAVGSG